MLNMTSQADRDGDGEIDREEFFNVMKMDGKPGDGPSAQDTVVPEGTFAELQVDEPCPLLLIETVCCCELFKSDSATHSNYRIRCMK